MKKASLGDSFSLPRTPVCSVCWGPAKTIQVRWASNWSKKTYLHTWHRSQRGPPGMPFPGMHLSLHLGLCSPLLNLPQPQGCSFLLICGEGKTWVPPAASSRVEARHLLPRTSQPRCWAGEAGADPGGREGRRGGRNSTGSTLRPEQLPKHCTPCFFFMVFMCLADG